MSLKNINNKLQSKRGFTIVELLIVIVVIGILASITIVAFNGVTARANATAAEAAASSVLKKAEAYNAENSGFPTASSDLTGAGAQAESYGIPATSIVFDSTTTPGLTVAPASSAASTVKFYTCDNALGIQVQYWDYAASTPAWTTLTTGVCTTPVFVAA